jgi:citrate lyase synthetase
LFLDDMSSVVLKTKRQTTSHQLLVEKGSEPRAWLSLFSVLRILLRH